MLVLHIANCKVGPSALRRAVADALRIGKGTLRLLDHENRLHPYSKARVSPVTGRSFEPPDPAPLLLQLTPRMVPDLPRLRRNRHHPAQALRFPQQHSL